MQEPSAVLAAAAGVIAGTPGVWSRLLLDHVADADGRCRGCPSSLHVAPRWPCRLALLASAARAEHERSRRRR